MARKSRKQIIMEKVVECKERIMAGKPIRLKDIPLDVTIRDLAEIIGDVSGGAFDLSGIGLSIQTAEKPKKVRREKGKDKIKGKGPKGA